MDVKAFARGLNPRKVESTAGKPQRGFSSLRHKQETVVIKKKHAGLVPPDSLPEPQNEELFEYRPAYSYRHLLPIHGKASPHRHTCTRTHTRRSPPWQWQLG